jgi:hypothetical protein
MAVQNAQQGLGNSSSLICSTSAAQQLQQLDRQLCQQTLLGSSMSQ